MRYCTVGLLCRLAGSGSDHGSPTHRWSSRGPVLDGDSQRLDSVPSPTAEFVHLEGRLVFDQRVESPAGRVPSALLMATARPPVGVTPVDVRLPPFRGRGAETDQLFSPSALHKANSRRALPSPALARAVTPDGVATRRSTCDGPAVESGSVGPTDRQFPLTRSKMPGSAPWAHAAPTTSSPMAPKATAVSASTPHPAVELSAASPRVEATVVQFVRSPLLVTTSPPPLRRSASS